MNDIKPDELLDLSGVGCPQNAARAILKLEGMDARSVLEVILDDGQPARNVPSALTAEGHTIVSMEQTGSQWHLLIRKTL